MSQDSEKFIDDILSTVDSFTSRGAPLIIAVMDCESSSSDLPFCYTVGMRNLGFPEVIISGISGQMGHAMIMNLVADFKKRGVRDCLGLNSNIITKYDVRVTPIISTRELLSEFMCMTANYDDSKGANPKETEVVQILWPNKHGELPDEVNVFPGQYRFPPKAMKVKK